MTLEEQFDRIAKCSLFRLDGECIDIVDALADITSSILDEDEPDWSLGECDAFAMDALIIGAYWAMVHYHGDQGSPEYATQCVLETIYKTKGEGAPENDTSEKYVCDTICTHLLNKASCQRRKEK